MTDLVMWGLGMAGIVGLTCFISWVMETLDINL
jgi:hypothetical protein